MLYCVQCDQIGLFLTVRNYIFSYKIGPNIHDFLGSFDKQHFLSEICFGWLLGQHSDTIYSNIWSHWLCRAFKKRFPLADWAILVPSLQHWFAAAKMPHAVTEYWTIRKVNLKPQITWYNGGKTKYEAKKR